MFKKLFALLMVLSVAVLFTGCSNSNSYDNVPRPIPYFIPMDGGDGTFAVIGFKDEKGADIDSNLYKVEIIKDRKWKVDVYLNGSTQPISVTAADNENRKKEGKVYLDFKANGDNTYDVSVNDKSHSIYEADKIIIEKFAYTIDGMEYEVEPNVDILE